MPHVFKEYVRIDPCQLTAYHLVIVKSPVALRVSLVDLGNTEAAISQWQRCPYQLIAANTGGLRNLSPRSPTSRLARTQYANRSVACNGRKVLSSSQWGSLEQTLSDGGRETSDNSPICCFSLPTADYITVKDNISYGFTEVRQNCKKAERLIT